MGGRIRSERCRRRIYLGVKCAEKQRAEIKSVSGGEGFSGAGFGARRSFADHGEIGRDAEVAGAPVAHVGHHGDEVVTGFGEVVSDLRRRGRFYFTLDDSVLFELTQLRGENFFADSGQKFANFRETAWHET